MFDNGSDAKSDADIDPVVVGVIVREFTLQIPRTGSVPHPHLTWRQEEENHGVSKS